MNPPWPRKPLGEVLDVASGQVDPKASEYRNLPHVGSENIASGTGELIDVATPAALGLTSGKYYFTADHVLYSKIRPYLNKVVVPGFAGVSSADIYPLLPRPEVLTKHFLLHLLRTRDFLDYAATCSSRTSIPKINRPALLSYNAPIPPLPEQRRIATILDQADAIRRKRQQTIKLSQELLRSVFMEMFGDPVTNPKGWTIVTLDNLFEIARGGSPRPIDAYVTDDPAGVNWVTITDASASYKYISATKRRIRQDGARRSRAVQPGDFLLTNSMSFGRPYIMRTTGCIHDGWLVLSPRRVNLDPDFMYSLLSTNALSAEFARRATGSTVKNLNIDRVRKVPIILPPFASQRAFAQRGAAIDNALSHQRSSMHHIEELSSSLVQRAFRGQL